MDQFLCMPARRIDIEGARMQRYGQFNIPDMYKENGTCSVSNMSYINMNDKVIYQGSQLMW